MHWILLTGLLLFAAIVLFMKYPILAVLAMVGMGASVEKITEEDKGMMMGLVVILFGLGGLFAVGQWLIN